MYSTDFPDSNTTIGKPGNMTDEQCLSIRAHIGVDTQNFPFILVAFKPNIDDIKAMNEGRPLYVKFIGRQMPPVAMFTLDENGNANFE